MANAPDLESEILARELVRLGGFGARWVARFLPNIPYEVHLELVESPTVVTSNVRRLIAELGKHVPELKSDENAGLFTAVVGSGRLNLNPTIVSVQIHALDSRTSVFIRAVANEGAIKQHSARTAVERIKPALLGETP